MSVVDAAKRLALRQVGGVSGLAARMGLNPSSFAHKLAEHPGANLFARELEQMTMLTQDPEIAQAMALACNHVCIPVVPMIESGELGKEIVAVGKEFGDLMQATQQAIEDGSVTARELAHFERQFIELISAAAALRSRIAQRIPSPPGTLKVAK